MTGIRGAAKFAKERFPTGIALDTCHCNAQIADKLDAELEAALEDSLWVQAVCSHAIC